MSNKHWVFVIFILAGVQSATAQGQWPAERASIVEKCPGGKVYHGTKYPPKFIGNQIAYTWQKGFKSMRVPFAFLVDENGEAKGVSTAKDVFTKATEKERILIKRAQELTRAAHFKPAKLKNGTPVCMIVNWYISFYKSSDLKELVSSSVERVASALTENCSLGKGILGLYDRTKHGKFPAIRLDRQGTLNFDTGIMSYYKGRWVRTVHNIYRWNPIDIASLQLSRGLGACWSVELKCANGDCIGRTDWERGFGIKLYKDDSIDMDLASREHGQIALDALKELQIALRLLNE